MGLENSGVSMKMQASQDRHGLMCDVDQKAS